MRVITVFILLLSSFSYGQSEIIDRLQRAAEVEFGFYDTVYPDTFLVQNYRTDTAELYFIVQPYDSSKRNPELFAYRKSDSSALNGTIIYQQFKNEYYQNSSSQSYTRNARLYENGQQIRHVSRGYFRFSTSYFADEPKFDGTLFDPIKNGFSLRQLSGGGYRYDYMNDTLTFIYFDSTHNSDTAFYESVNLYRNGTLKSYSAHQYPGEYNGIFELKLNESGDTTKLENFVDYRRFGLCIEDLYGKETPFYLKTIWHNDTLLDVLNPKILFVDHKDKVITKQEFCALVHYPITPNATLNTNYWNVRHISDAERNKFNIPYRIVLSKKPEREYFYLQSEKRKETDEEVLESFLKKNRKRIEALNEN
jgi:hypothetical protein